MNSFRFLDAGHQRGDRAPDRAARGGRRRSSQETLHFDPRTGRLTPAALQGGGARLPLLPRARPRPARADRGDARRRRATRCPSCRPSAPSATSATGRCRRTPRGCSRSGPSSATTSRRPRPPPARTSRRPSWPRGSRTSCVGRLDAEADPAASNVTPQALAKLAGLVQAGSVTRGAARQVLDRLVEARRRPRGDHRGRGPRRDGRRRRARRDRRARHRGATPTSPSACAAATRRRSARSSAP